MSGIPWTTEEHQDALDLSWEDFDTKYQGKRTFLSYVKRRQMLRAGQIPIEVSFRPPDLPQVDFNVDKEIENFHWRDAARWIDEGQRLKKNASSSQEYAHFVFDVDHPIAVLCLSDLHIGAWSTDHNLLAAITDEILANPHLYIILVGDVLHMAIKLRGVLEVSDNLLPPGLQKKFLISWLKDIEHRVLCAGWGNHDIEREEVQAGSSEVAGIFSRRVVYFNGIGNVDITVGNQTYNLVMSHHFRGRSIYNPVHGAQRYLILEDASREIAIAGDSHVPGIMTFVHGTKTKVALNAGTIQTNSGYAKRYFSLYTHPVFPLFTLDNEDHLITPYWNLRSWGKAVGGYFEP